MNGYNQFGYQPQQTWMPQRQQMPQYQQDYGAVQYQQPGMICRPVASIDEARATPTDFSGNALVLTDLAHGMIYTKVLDAQTGSSIFGVYQRVQEPQPPQAQEYAPMALVEQLRQEVATLKAALEMRGRHEREVSDYDV